MKEKNEKTQTKQPKNDITRTKPKNKIQNKQKQNPGKTKIPTKEKHTPEEPPDKNKLRWQRKNNLTRQHADNGKRQEIIK